MMQHERKTAVRETKNVHDDLKVSYFERISAKVSCSHVIVIVAMRLDTAAITVLEVRSYRVRSLWLDRDCNTLR